MPSQRLLSHNAFALTTPSLSQRLRSHNAFALTTPSLSQRHCSCLLEIEKAEIDCFHIHLAFDRRKISLFSLKYLSFLNSLHVTALQHELLSKNPKPA